MAGELSANAAVIPYEPLTLVDPEGHMLFNLDQALLSSLIGHNDLPNKSLGEASAVKKIFRELGCRGFR